MPRTGRMKRGWRELDKGKVYVPIRLGRRRHSRISLRRPRRRSLSLRTTISRKTLGGKMSVGGNDISIGGCGRI